MSANTVMTWDEIVAAYPNEWVLIADLELDDTRLEVRRGRVVLHSANVGDIDGKAVALGLRSSAVLYAGADDLELAVLL